MTAHTLHEKLTMSIDDVLELQNPEDQRDIFNMYLVAGSQGRLRELKMRYDRDPEVFSHIPEPLQVRHLGNHLSKIVE